MSNWLEELWEEIKKPIYKVAEQDSRNVAKFANAIGWQGLEDEAKENVDNPGRAIGKAAVNAALWWAGGSAGNALGGSGSAGGAAGGGAGELASVGEAGGTMLGGAGSLAGSGLFNAAGQGAQMTTEQIAQQALMDMIAQQGGQVATEAVAQSLPQSLASSGMFNQIPGVTAGSPQWDALMAQTGEFGGQGANMTAQSAMPAVKDAYAAGDMGTFDYLKQVGKGDLAGINDPRVLYDRLITNGGRFAKTAGKNMAKDMAMQAMSPGQQGGGGYRAPAPRSPRQAQPMPQPQTAASKAMQEMAISDFRAGRISLAEFMKRIQGVA